ncbi:hypothetical protein llap_8336 [Limosa lapponica baueri]|uniref:Uncharacterized protein n=1 Tax=Limosa lapponica baueri TaxID=1758121 RepID=A0A2I0U5S0_LIMLA|nr:hypothetical protein llap_8336 [Limosa lapponica baueri]
MISAFSRVEKRLDPSCLQFFLLISQQIKCNQLEFRTSSTWLCCHNRSQKEPNCKISLTIEAVAWWLSYRVALACTSGAKGKSQSDGVKGRKTPCDEGLDEREAEIYWSSSWSVSSSPAPPQAFAELSFGSAGSA